MGNTNSTNKIRDIFDRDVKNVFNKIGNVAGGFLKLGESMMQNMMKLTNNLGNLMGSSIFPYLIVVGGIIYVGFRTKML